MFEFGAGTLWGFPVGANTAPNPTPMKFERCRTYLWIFPAT
jgi:hypothetical protein